MKKILAVFLLLASICSAQVQTGGLSIPGDDAVQVGKKSAGFSGDRIEDVYKDNVVFVGYVTSYDYATGSTAMWYDRGPLNNSVASMATETWKPGITVTHGCRAMSGSNVVYKGLYGFLSKVVGSKFSIAMLYSNFAKFDGTTRYPVVLGDLNPYFSIRPDTAAGGGVSKLYIEQTGGVYSVTNAKTFLASDTFYTLIGTFDGAAANTKWYVDGEAAGTSGTIPNTPTLDSGRWNVLGLFPNSYPADIRIVVYAIFDKKLSDDEASNVHKLMNDAKTYIAAGGTM